jgi:phage shock protein PspC (stress-responsive transcriptional regulator)
MDTTTASTEPGLTSQTRPVPLTRSRQNRMLAGVASGIAGYTGVDVLLVRIAFVALTFLGGAAVPVYLACWLLMPDESSGHSIAADVTSGLQTRKI